MYYAGGALLLRQFCYADEFCTFRLRRQVRIMLFAAKGINGR